MDVDNFTDAQLRRKLSEYGFPMMPITSTTRKIMIKKLKLLMESQQKTARSTMGKYSSDEDAENDHQTRLRRRATVATASTSTTNHTHKRRTKSTGISGKQSNNSLLNNINLRNLQESDSDDLFEQELQHLVAGEEENSMDIELDLRVEDTSGSFHSDYNLGPGATPTPPKMFTSSPRQFTSSIRRPEPRLNSQSQSNSSASFNSSLELDGQVLSTPYLSNFSKRLSLLTQGQRQQEKHNQQRQAVQSKNTFIRVKEVFSRTRQRVKYFLNLNAPNLNLNLHWRHVASPSQTGNLVSLLLVAGVGAFFAVLLTLYYGMHVGSNTNDIVGLTVPYCTEKIVINCLTKEQADGAVDLYKILKPRLAKIAIEVNCGSFSDNTHSFLTDSEIVQYIESHFKIEADSDVNIIEDLDSLVLLASKNQFLGISVFKVDKNHEIVDDSTTSDSNGLSVVGAERAFGVLSPSLPLNCWFRLKLTALFRVFLLFFAFVSFIFLANFVYKRYLLRKAQARQEIVSLVEQVVEILQTQTNSDEDFLVINHVRDMIIPIDERKTMRCKWLQAIAFIDENESRIRTEVQVVKGESYEVWRWISSTSSNSLMVTPSASPSPAAGVDLWQGRAFEAASPPCSPSPCLKIRGMIDEKYENAQAVNRDAIIQAVLKKCGPECRVLHVFADAHSKCVYLKCAGTEEAAIAYKQLHGQWFGGQLVSVKYLRLERYMQRFPESPQSGPFLN